MDDKTFGCAAYARAAATTAKSAGRAAAMVRACVLNALVAEWIIRRQGAFTSAPALSAATA